VEERAKEKEKKWVVSLQQEPTNIVRRTSGSCINSEELTTI
jgi:hypothetical protein